MPVVRCYPGNQLVEPIATLATLRPHDLDHELAVAHGHFCGLAVAGTDFIGECFRHSQCEAIAPLLKCHPHLRSPALKEAFAERYGILLSAIRQYEIARTIPPPAVRAYLTVIEREPEMAARALHPDAA
jgi:hypothetical protein